MKAFKFWLQKRYFRKKKLHQLSLTPGPECRNAFFSLIIEEQKVLPSYDIGLPRILWFRLCDQSLGTGILTNISVLNTVNPAQSAPQMCPVSGCSTTTSPTYQCGQPKPSLEICGKHSLVAPNQHNALLSY